MKMSTISERIALVTGGNRAFAGRGRTGSGAVNVANMPLNGSGLGHAERAGDASRLVGSAYGDRA